MNYTDDTTRCPARSAPTLNNPSHAWVAISDYLVCHYCGKTKRQQSSAGAAR